MKIMSNFKCQISKLISNLSARGGSASGGKSQIFCLCILLLFSACGSNDSGAVITPTGPDLDMSELTSIKIDQLKFTGGIENDKDGVPEVAIYLRCADNNTDIACAGPKTGLDLVKKVGTTYGKLNATFEPVEGVTEDNCFDVKLIFVEKDSANCPSAITNDDDIIWTSPALSLNDKGKGSLLNSAIENDDKSIMTYLIAQGDEFEDELILKTNPQTDNVLRVDQLYFKSPAIENQAANFRLWLNDASGGTFRCEATFTSATSGIEKENIIYGNLGIELLDQNLEKCLVTDENKYTDVTVSLYISTSNDTVTTKEPTTLLDLVDNDGGKELFGDTGFIRFTPIDGIK